MQYLIPGGADIQVITGPGGGDAGDGYRSVDIHVATVVVVDDLNGGVAFVAEILGAPLAETVAGYVPAVAVGGEDGLAHAGTGKIVGKDGIHQTIHVCVDVPSPDPLLVIGGGGGNGEVIALIPIQRNLWF